MFTFNAAMFAAAVTALSKGATLDSLAKSAELCGMAPSKGEYISAHEEYVRANAFTVSREGLNGLVATAKPSKAKGSLKLLRAVAAHNAEFPKSSPLSVVAILCEDGESFTFKVESFKVSKARRASQSKASGGKGISRKSALKIAQDHGHKDGYTVKRTGAPRTQGGEGYTYFLNGKLVEGALSEALYNLDLHVDTKTRQDLLKYYPLG